MQDVREVAREWAEAYNAHDEERLRAVLAPDARLVSPEGPFEGESAITTYMMAWADAFGGGYTVHRVTSEDQTVVLEMTWRGVHTGTYVTPDGDVPATGREVEARSSHSVDVADGVVREVRMYFDVFGFLSQLGLLPAGSAG